MDPRRAVAIALGSLLLGSLVGGVAPAGAVPPPEPLCDACGDSFEAAAEDHGVDLHVEHSTARILVHGNGSATWTVRNRLAEPDAAARLRANRSLRTAVTDGGQRDTAFLGANVSDDGVVTARYRDRDFASESAGGALRSDVFTRLHGNRNVDGLGADELVVVAPENMRIGWSAPGATVSDDGGRMTLTEFEERGFVTFVPRNSDVGPLLSVLAVASTAGWTLAINATLFVALPAAAFGILVAAVAGVIAWRDPDVERVRARAGLGIGGSAVLVAVLSTFALATANARTALPLAVTATVLALLGAAFSRPDVRERATYARLLGVAALGTIVAIALTIAGTLAFGRGVQLSAVAVALPVVVPIVSLLPAGYALGQGNRWLAIATAVGAFALSMLPLVPVVPFTAVDTVAGIVLLVVGTGYGVVAAIVGAPMLLAGASFTADATADSLWGNADD